MLIGPMIFPDTNLLCTKVGRQIVIVLGNKSILSMLGPVGKSILKMGGDFSGATVHPAWNV